MRFVSAGDNVMSVMRFESGLSILYGWVEITGSQRKSSNCYSPFGYSIYCQYLYFGFVALRFDRKLQKGLFGMSIGKIPKNPVS
jgi:hypothetical protein